MALNGCQLISALSTFVDFIIFSLLIMSFPKLFFKKKKRKEMLSPITTVIPFTELTS